MFRRNLLAALAFELAVFAAPTFGQTANTADLARFVPGKWMYESSKVGIELESVKDGVVTGKWLDRDGTVYPIAAAWVKGKVASGRFDKGVFHMVTPPGNKFELNLSPDGSTLSGTRQVINGYEPGLQQVTFKRN
jgi:hypothetical protein